MLYEFVDSSFIIYLNVEMAKVHLRGKLGEGKTPKPNTTTLRFTLIEVNLLVRATEHLIDAYKSLVKDHPAVKATVTNLHRLKNRFSRAASRLAKQP